MTIFVAGVGLLDNQALIMVLIFPHNCGLGGFLFGWCLLHANWQIYCVPFYQENTSCKRNIFKFHTEFFRFERDWLRLQNKAQIRVHLQKLQYIYNNASEHVFMLQNFQYTSNWGHLWIGNTGSDRCHQTLVANTTAYVPVHTWACRCRRQRAEIRATDLYH